MAKLITELAVPPAGRLLVLGILIAYAALKKKLTRSGLLVATAVGYLHAAAATALPLTLLTTFFLVGTFATKVHAEAKEKLVHQVGNQHARTATQVLCNSAVACVLLVGAALYPRLSIEKALVAHYAAVAADTCSSELGVLSTEQPVLVSTFKPVPKGTNGGITILGCLAGLLGAAIIGIATLPFANWLLFSCIYGLVGTFVDSLLGATMQLTVLDTAGKVYETPGELKVAGGKYVAGRDVLTNNQVNLLTAAVTSACALVVS